MRSNGRLAPLVYSTLATLAGAVAMAVLVHVSLKEPAAHVATGSEAVSPADGSRRLDHFEFVRPGALAREPNPPEHPMLRPSIDFETDGEPAWSTEIRPETAPPPSAWTTMLSPFRLPWQTATPGAPQRTYTLRTRLAEIAPTANVRLAARFDAARAPWPPAEVAFVAIKDERQLELHARAAGGEWTLIHRYRVLAASGGAGPKLRQGDKQVPEGIYSIAFLNPNSAYHVSMRVNYPNAFDRQMAAKEGRRDLGGDIMIHGKNLSAGCLAMGDEAVEELFVLAAQTGLANTRLIIAPTDFRQKGVPASAPGQPAWLPRLYGEIALAMSRFKPPPPQPSTGLLSFFTR